MKKIYSLIVFALICIPSFSQSGNWQWARQATGLQYEEGMSCATDPSGNVYTVGTIDQNANITFGTVILTNAGNSDMVIVKYSPTGSVLWASSAGGSGDDYGNSVATDASGNVYVTGSFNSPSIHFGSVTLINPLSGMYDVCMFIVKYSSTGTVLWAKLAGNNGGACQGNAITTDASSNVYVTGYFASPILVFGNDTLHNSGNDNIYIVAYSSSGTVLWAKSGAGNSYDYGNSITTDPSGNVFVKGWFTSTLVFDTVTLTSIGNHDVFIAKYSATGAVLWAKSAGGSGTDDGMSVATDDLGNSYLTGDFQSTSITFGSTLLTNLSSSQYYGDAFIVKYSPTGTVLIAKRAGGANNDVGYSVATVRLGITNAINVYLTGGFKSSAIIFDSDTLLFNGYDPMFIVKYDDNLNVICAAELASGGDDWSAVATDNYGNAFISGDFYNVSPFIVGTDILTLTGNENIFTAKFNCNGTTVNTNEILNSTSLSIYPNPFTSQTTISFSEIQKHTTIKITDVLGKEIKTVILSAAKNLTIEKGEMSDGIYIVQITDENKNVVNRKIVIN